VLLVPMDSPVRSVADLVALGRSRPEGLTYASQGVAAGGHILGMIFGRSTGIPLVHVPYRGAAPAAADLAAGRADFLFASYASTNPQITAGRIRPIATTGSKGELNIPGYPDLQTMAEAGFPEARLDAWFALYAPAGTPDDVVRMLHERFAKALRSDAVVERLTKLNMQVSKDSTPASLTAKIKDEMAMVGPVLKELTAKQK
jgi:tripartite-type tricarboxylate transporter receptor subunit TctC